MLVFKKVTFEEVLAVLDYDHARPMAVAYWGKHGCSPSKTWRERRTKEIVSDSLTHVQDVLEYEKQTKARHTQWLKIREVRRRLEWELWP